MWPLKGLLACWRPIALAASISCLVLCLVLAFALGWPELHKEGAGTPGSNTPNAIGPNTVSAIKAEELRSIQIPLELFTSSHLDQAPNVLMTLSGGGSSEATSLAYKSVTSQQLFSKETIASHLQLEAKNGDRSLITLSIAARDPVGHALTSLRSEAQAWSVLGVVLNETGVVLASLDSSVALTDFVDNFVTVPLVIVPLATASNRATPEGSLTCGTSDVDAENPTPEESPVDGGFGERAVQALEIVRLVLHSNESYTARHGGAAGAQARMESIFNSVAGIFRQQLNVRLRIVGVRAWGAGDPFAGDDAGPLITQFYSHLRSAYPNGREYDAGHLFIGENLRSGSNTLIAGIATYSFGASSDVAIVEDRNSFAQDVSLSAHEVGHHFSLGHSSSGVMTPILGTSWEFSSESRQSVDDPDDLRRTQQVLNESNPPAAVVVPSTWVSPLSWEWPTPAQNLAPFNQYPFIPVQWDYPHISIASGEATSFDLFRATSPAACAGAPHVATHPGLGFFDHYAGSPVSALYYSVRGRGPGGVGACAEFAPFTPPSTPTLSVTLSTDPAQPNAVWVSRSDSPTMFDNGINIYAANDPSARCVGVPVRDFRTATSPIPVTPGVPTYFTARAVNGLGMSPCSAVASIPAPRSMRLWASQQSDAVQLSASAGTPQNIITNYSFFRSDTRLAADFRQIAFLQGYSSGSYLDQGAPADGRVQYYFANACNISGCSDSEIIESGRLVQLAPLTGFSASDGTSVNSIVLRWDKPYAAVQNYSVSVPCDTIGTVSPTCSGANCTLTIDALNCDNSFTSPIIPVTLTATNSLGSVSVTDEGWMVLPPRSPISLRSHPRGVEVAYVLRPFTNFYRISRSSSAAGPFTVLANNFNGSPFIDQTAQVGSSYYYEIASLYNGLVAPVVTQQITVQPTLTFTTQPNSIDAPVGAAVSFVAAFEANFSPQLQWQVKGVALGHLQSQMHKQVARLGQPRAAC